LQILSNQVVTQMELSKHTRELKDAIVDLRETQKSLKEAKEYAELASVSSFENLLLSPSGIEAFQAFLEEQFSQENFEFWKVSFQ